MPSHYVALYTGAIAAHTAHYFLASFLNFKISLSLSLSIVVKYWTASEEWLLGLARLLQPLTATFTKLSVTV